jgi:hypothetical protein
MKKRKEVKEGGIADFPGRARAHSSDMFEYFAVIRLGVILRPRGMLVVTDRPQLQVTQVPMRRLLAMAWKDFQVDAVGLLLGR